MPTCRRSDLAARLGLKYYTFISQVENGFSRVPTEIMGAWANELGLEQAAFARHLLMYYEPELHRLLFGAERNERSLRSERKPAAGAWSEAELNTMSRH